MKTKKLNKKLVLNKTTVADLDGGQMSNVLGGTGIRTWLCSILCRLNTSNAEPCDCNTSDAEPCECITVLPGCNTSVNEPCVCY